MFTTVSQKPASVKKWLLYGLTGTGKTLSSYTSALKTAIICCEPTGLTSLTPTNVAHLYPSYVGREVSTLDLSTTEAQKAYATSYGIKTDDPMLLSLCMIHAYRLAVSSGFQFIMVDSISAFHNTLLEKCKNMFADGRMAYQKAQTHVMTLIAEVMDSPIHTCVTAHAAETNGVWFPAMAQKTLGPTIAHTFGDVLFTSSAGYWETTGNYAKSKDATLEPVIPCNWDNLFLKAGIIQQQ